MKTNKIVCIVGPSGVGKTSIVEKLRCATGLVPWSEVISTTSRAPRSGERDGEHYHFKDREFFEDDSNHFIELVEYHGNYYGLLMDDFMKPIMQNKTPLVVVEREGVRHLEDFFGDKWVMPILIIPPSLDALRDRLTEDENRTLEDVEARMATAADEIQFDRRFDKVVINDNLREAAGEVEQTVWKALNKKRWDQVFNRELLGGR